mgnify:CR=1 FL=1
MDQIKQFFCGLTHYYAVQCTRYLKFICLHFAVGYPTSNAIFSSILRWNVLVLVFKWKLRTWGIQKCPYMSLCKLPNLSYKPPNIIGPFYLIAAVIYLWHSNFISLAKIFKLIWQSEPKILCFVIDGWLFFHLDK